MLREVMARLTGPDDPIRQEVLRVLRGSSESLLVVVTRSLAERVSDSDDPEAAQPGIQALLELGDPAISLLVRSMFASPPGARLACARTLSRLAPALGPTGRFHLCYYARIVSRSGKGGELAGVCERLYQELIERLERECQASAEIRRSLAAQWFRLPMMPNDERLRAICEFPDPAVCT
jgi:hypothetical protein